MQTISKLINGSYGRLEELFIHFLFNIHSFFMAQETPSINLHSHFTIFFLGNIFIYNPKKNQTLIFIFRMLLTFVLK